MAGSTAYTARFITHRISMQGYAAILAFMVVSVAGLALAVALSTPETIKPLAYLLASVPLGGFMALSWLLNTKVEYRLSDEGIEQYVAPAARLSLVRAAHNKWNWKDVSDYLTDEDRVLGRFGMLEVGLRVRPGTLRIAPHRKKEASGFRRFVTIFHGYVEELNADKTKRAVEVATIRPRITFYQKPAARPVAILLAAGSLAAVLAATMLELDPDRRWQLIYLSLLACISAAYVVRRTFFSERHG